MSAVPLYVTLVYYNKGRKVIKYRFYGQKESFMESLITIFIVVSVMVLSVYVANLTKDVSKSKNHKMNDIFTFSLPFAATMAIGIAVIPDIFCLPIVITAALLAGTLSLLISWSKEQKLHEAESKKADIRYVVFVVFKRASLSA